MRVSSEEWHSYEDGDLEISQAALIKKVLNNLCHSSE